MKKVISSFLYISSIVPIFFLTIFFAQIMLDTIGPHTIWSTGDVGGFLFALLWSAVIFGLISHFLLWFEALKRPTIIDHIQYCVFLYIILAFLLIKLIGNYFYDVTFFLDIRRIIIIVVVLVIGIIVNGMILYLKSRSYSVGNLS